MIHQTIPLNPQKKTVQKTHFKSSSIDQKSVWVLAAILLLSLIVYWPATRNQFVNWDDNAHVFENIHLKKTFTEALPYFFGQHYFIGNYIPFTMMVYYFGYRVAGLDPHFFHGLNVGLHLANILLTFWCFYLLSGRKRLVGVFVALFFALHPMHVESVAWISELKDLLYSLFFLGGMIAYQYYLEEKGKYNSNASQGILVRLRTYFPFIVFLFFVCSLLSKPAAMVFPLVLMLIDYFRGRTINAKSLLEKIPFLFVSFVFGIIALSAQQSDRLLHDAYTFPQKMLYACYALVVYLLKFIAPFQLCNFYPYPELGGQSSFLIYLSPVIVMILIYLVLRSVRRDKLFLFGAGFFLINLILVLQLVSVGDAFLAERYTYMAYSGLLFILGIKTDEVLVQQRQKGKMLRQVLVALIGVYVMVFAYTSHERSKVWKNDESLANDLLQKQPEDWLALNNKGFILYEKQQYTEAIRLFGKALEHKPDYTRASINLANTYLLLDQADKALEITNSALSRAPKDFHLLANKGFILMRYFKKYDEAILSLKASLREKAGQVSCYLDLSECYYQNKDFVRSMSCLDSALSIEPQNAMLWNNKGYLYYLQSDFQNAMVCYKKSLAFEPSYTLASENLAICEKAMVKDPNQVK
ncbi:MAG TPA: tetratricopeptide repeat protein [Bacteroidia bacterium]|nr:tetratricopeptide repeat protein [Bacteroidia bacterium]